MPRPQLTPRKTIAARLLVFLFALAAAATAQQARVNLADGFDFPVGKPNGDGYYKARGLRLREPRHYGEDWNGRAGGDKDLGDPGYAIADGIVTPAANVRTVALVEVIFAQIVSRRIFRQATDRRQLIGMAVLLAGVAALLRVTA